MKRILVFLASMILSTTSFGQDVELMNAAKNAFENKNYPEALQKADSYIKSNPSDANGYFLRGRIKNRQNNHESAITDFDKALELDKNLFWVYDWRGGSKRYLFRYQEAIDDYNIGIEKIKAADVKTLYADKGDVHTAMGRLDDAIADYSKAIELDHEYYYGYANRGMVYYHQKKYTSAMDDFSKAIELKPEYLSPFYFRGKIKVLQSGSYQAASEDLEKVLAATQASPTTQTAFIYLYRGEPEKGFDLLLQLVTSMKDVELRIGYYNLAGFCASQMKTQEALKYLDLALQGDLRSRYYMLACDMNLDPVRYKREFRELLIKHQVPKEYMAFNNKKLVEDYVTVEINNWQKKGRYEKLSDFQNRVSEVNRQMKIREMVRVAVDTIALNQIDWSRCASNYDADNESFKIEFPGFNPVFIKVPLQEAEAFDKSVKKLRYRNSSFALAENNLIIAHLEIENPANNKTYIYDSKESVAYSVPQLVFNFDPVNLQQTGSTAQPVQKQEVRQVTVGRSDVDVNIIPSLSSNSRTFALVIGNENYLNEIKVSFARNDATVFADYCRKSLGIPEIQVHLVTDATYGQMLNEIRWVTDVIKAFNGEVRVIFYYAGHGMPDEKEKRAYLLPVDGNSTLTQTAIKLDDLYSQLAAIPALSVTIFLDACFTGSSRDGILADGRGVKVKPRTEELSGNMVVLSATSEDETAFPYREKEHGLFTYYVLKKLQESRGEVTIKDLGDYVSSKVRQQSIVINNKPQTPQVKASAAMQNTWQQLKLNEK